MNKEYKSVIILHDIRSVVNVGAVFRTADAVGISKIYLSGYTPTPIDRFGRVRGDISKSALGAEKTIQWEYFKEIDEVFEKLKEEGFEIVGVEQDQNSMDYKKFKIKQDTVFLFGNEVEGVSKEVLKKCDKIIEIPMRGEKESLNVSVSAGVVLFRALDC